MLRIFDLISTTEQVSPAPRQLGDIQEPMTTVPSVRVVETKLPYPSYIIPLLVLTLAFLVVALSLLARLLDAIGRPISQEQISVLTLWTFGLSGIGLTLLVWGCTSLPLASFRGYSLSRAGTAFLITAIMSCESVYLFGPLVVDHFEFKATAAERQCAVRLRILAIARQDGAIALPASVRSLLMNGPITGWTCHEVPAASAEGVSTALRSLVELRRGTAEQAYDDAFIPSVRSLRDAFNDYVAAQLRLVSDIEAIPEKQAESWQLYLDRLSQAGVSSNHIPRRDWSRIGAEVRSSGVAVPSDWNPTDRATFMAAMATSLRRDAESKYNEFVLEHFKQNLPPSLEWKSFCAEPTIQARWRTMIDAPPSISLSPDMGFRAFRDMVYEPQLNSIISPRIEELFGSTDPFAPNGKFAAAGRVAAAWAMAPTFLFYLIIVLTMLHIARLLGLTCQILLPDIAATGRAAIVCVGFIMLLALFWMPPRDRAMLQSGTAERPVIVCSPSRPDCQTTYGIQLLWSLGSVLRDTVLFGFDFGYNPRLGITGSEWPIVGILSPDRPRQ